MSSRFVRDRHGSEASIEIGLDGQYKKRRSTLVKPKSARSTASRKARRIDGSACRLVSLAEIAEATTDPIEKASRIDQERRAKRSHNRNHRARRRLHKGRK